MAGATFATLKQARTGEKGSTPTRTSTELTVARLGRVDLSFSPSLDRALAMLGLGGGTCPSLLPRR
jgi:hypothetical protein